MKEREERRRNMAIKEMEVKEESSGGNIRSCEDKGEYRGQQGMWKRKER